MLNDYNLCWLIAGQVPDVVAKKKKELDELEKAKAEKLLDLSKKNQRYETLVCSIYRL
jgi:hypothetical protein